MEVSLHTADLGIDEDIHMVQVSDLNRSAEKFQRRASQAGQDFQDGVSEVSDSDQANATLEAADNWTQGVQDAISEGRFQSGVQDSTKSWQEETLEVGASRFTQGASQAGDTWRAEFQEYADTLESLSLQPRGPRGSEANFQRSRAVGEALNNQRDS
jgi:hypothetical protein